MYVCVLSVYVFCHSHNLYVRYMYLVLCVCCFSAGVFTVIFLSPVPSVVIEPPRPTRGDGFTLVIRVDRCDETNGPIRYISTTSQRTPSR